MINIKSINKFAFVFFLAAMSWLLLKLPVTLAQDNQSNSRLAQVAATQTAQVDTSNAGLVTRVAPGELLPISVKLANFGANKRADVVDVLVKYSISTSLGKEIYSTSETLAVETTANFVKTVQVPFETSPGTYIAKTSITYQGQLVPATTQFPFKVERKILGIFQSDFTLYGGIAVIASVLLILLGRILIKRRTTRYTPFDYSDISHDERTFYEIVSDTIAQMRERVGDDALVIAANIEGLKIDKNSGRILGFTKRPSKIIATLVGEYEKHLGKKVSFSLEREKLN